MEYIDEELQRVKNIKDSFKMFMIESVNEISDKVVFMIKERWSNGESVDGGDITNKATGGGYASLSYKNLKLVKNPKASGKVDLTFTGSLGDKIKLVINSSGDFDIISEDSKYNEIGLKFGFDEFGLNLQERETIMNMIEKSIIEKINNLKI